MRTAVYSHYFPVLFFFRCSMCCITDYTQKKEGNDLSLNGKHCSLQLSIKKWCERRQRYTLTTLIAPHEVCIRLGYIT